MWYNNLIESIQQDGGSTWCHTPLSILWQIQITFLDHKLELCEAEISYSGIMDNTKNII